MFYANIYLQAANLVNKYTIHAANLQTAWAMLKDVADGEILKIA